MNNTSLTNDPRLLRLSPEDNIRVALQELTPGQRVWVDGQWVQVLDRIPTGHKLAIQAIAPGEKVIKYGCPIGSATQPIQPGQHVHTHNLRSDYLPS